MKKSLKWVSGGLALMLSATALAGCTTKTEGNTSSTTSPGASAAVSKEPEKPVKLRVMLYDRGNAPEGMTLKEAPMVKWAIDEVKKIGIDLEYVPVPRASAGEKLNVWMASGEATDIVFTYDLNEFIKFADQGGLWELDSFIDKVGPNIKTNNKEALEVAGVYNGKRYAIPMYRANPFGGSIMGIRQDWLTKLNMKVPTTTDELYEVLKAFKEKDPGGVGKDKVIPWMVGPIGTGSKGFMYNVGYGFGLNMDGPALGGPDMPSGINRDGKFTTHIATPEGKELLNFMNRAYKEGLISKEFATDVNSQQLVQQLAKGEGGFIDNNDNVWNLNQQTKKALPDANWVPVDPFKRKDGSQLTGLNPAYGMFIMVPKSSKNPEAAVKFLNWMAQPEVSIALQSGLEGVHWKAEDGVRKAIDAAKNTKEINWYASYGDMSIMQQGQKPYTLDEMKKIYSANAGYVESIWPVWENFRKFGKPEPLITKSRPVAQKNLANIQKQLNESVTKVIMSADFEKTYAELISNWEKAGGREYDAEVTEGLKTLAK
jgi:putative aldouronate transport system substrate-binding protein